MTEKFYSKYDATTGEIVSLLTCDARTAEINSPTIEGHFDPSLFVVVGGKAVPKSQQEVDEQEIRMAWIELVQTRNEMLAASDWTQVPDAPVDHAAWAAYRQALRDLPDNTEDPRNPVWPSKPE